MSALAQENKDALESFIADQERAFEEKEKEGLEKLQHKQRDLTAQLENQEKAHFFQSQVASTLRGELDEIEVQISSVSCNRRRRSRS